MGAMIGTDRVRRGADLIFAEVDGEAVALSAARGACYGLDGVGLRVLQLIDPPTTVAEICRRLTAEYDVDESTCETDIVDLLEDLETEGLVKVERESQSS
jgi:hypothetical protein